METTSRYRLPRCRWASIWFGSIVVALSSAPLVQLSLRVTHDNLSSHSWAYMYPILSATTSGIAYGAYRLGRADKLAPPVTVVLALGFAGWTLLSALWTRSPSITPTQGALAASVIACGVAVGGTVEIRDQVRGAWGASQLLVVLSLGQQLLPSARVDFTGKWVGLFASRNTLGPFCTLALFATAALVLVERPRHLFTRAGLAGLALLDVVVAVRAANATSVVALGAASATAGVAWWASRPPTGLKPRSARSALAWALGGCVMAVLGAVVLASRDTSFTGRTLIWGYVVDAIGERPVLGWGFGAFWDDPANVSDLNREALGVIDNAHNSLLEIWLALGVIGALLFVALLAVGGYQLLRDLKHEHHRLPAVWALGLFSFMLVENAAEAMVRYHSTFWLLLIVAVASASPVRVGFTRRST